MPVEQTSKTENEKKKDYLRSYRKHVRLVQRISVEVDELKEMLKSTKAINYDGMPHGFGGQGDLSGEIARIQGLIDNLNYEKKMRIESYTDIVQRIRSLKSQNEDDVLYYRYIKGEEWWEIADHMKFTERHIHRIHGKALAHFQMPNKDVIECQ